jgi:hypothetical protein
MGGHPKELAEGSYAGFCLISINNLILQLLVFFDESLARRQKWLPKRHPSSTVGANNIRLGFIRSSVMSHITFIMCQFVLIVHLRDYHYDFDLDIVVLLSCYGVLRLTYTTYQNLCPTVHFFGQLLMSQDTSPTWILLLESINRINQVFFRIFPMF